MESLFPFSKNNIDDTIRTLLEKPDEEKEKDLANNPAYQSGLRQINESYDAREKKLRWLGFPSAVVMGVSLFSILFLGTMKSSAEADLNQHKSKAEELSHIVTYQKYKNDKLDIKDSYVFVESVHRNLGRDPSPESLQSFRSSLEQQVSELEHSQQVQEANRKIEHYGKLVIFPFGGLFLGFGLGIAWMLKSDINYTYRSNGIKKLKEKYGVKQDE